MIGNQLLYSIDEASKILNIKVSRLRMAVFRREIGHVKLNRLVRFSKSHLEEWIRQGEVRRLN